jgi:hypothetical protein
MDGLTNGQELGDPDCNWKPGDVPKMDAKSHPGEKSFKIISYWYCDV